MDARGSGVRDLTTGLTTWVRGGALAGKWGGTMVGGRRGSGSVVAVRGEGKVAEGGGTAAWVRWAL